MQSPVEKATKEIVAAVWEAARKHGLRYAEVVRAQTFAMVSVNETHRTLEPQAV
jgi:hypothetical protein